VCNWKSNNARPNFSGSFYQNRVTKLAYCGLTRSVLVIIDAYGENDLRAAHQSTLLLEEVGGRDGQQRRVVSVSTQTHEYRVRGQGHQVCVLHFPANVFTAHVDKGARLFLHYVFNGEWHNGLRGTDYECIQLLELTLSDAACFFRGGALPQGCRRKFELRPLQYDHAANGAHTWGLPQNVLDRYAAGNWGQGPR